MELKNITIIGGGNMGLAMASEMTKNTDYSITLVTSRPKELNGKISVRDRLTNETSFFTFKNVTDDYAAGTQDADVIFITLPLFLLADMIFRIKPKKNSIVCFVPGIGGREFFCRHLIEQGCIVCGLDRVPLISRVNKETKEVLCSKQPQTRVGVLHEVEGISVPQVITELLNITCTQVANYLTITLTPVNPILHPSRLYSLFKDATLTTPFASAELFYAEWDDLASQMLLDTDAELQNICRVFTEHGLPMTQVISLKQYYDVETVPELTEKIRSIKSLAKIESPFIRKDGAYFIDETSRYFTEDFPFGLCVFRAFAVIAGIETPAIDTLIRWYEKLVGKEYLIGKDLAGSDLKGTSIPHNFGLRSIEDVVTYYKAQ